MKETIKGYDTAMKKKMTPTEKIISLSIECEDIKLEMERLYKKWIGVKNERLSLSHKLKALEEERSKIIVELRKWF